VDNFSATQKEGDIIIIKYRKIKRIDIYFDSVQNRIGMKRH
jgi:hypothetical protein